MTTCALTCFAPAERADSKELARASHRFLDAGFFGSLMDRLPEMVLLLNPQRQIVYANQPALAAGGATTRAEVVGLRPGELLRCKNFGSAPGGCGTSESCRYCGAVRAILDAQAGKPTVQECRLLVHSNNHEEALDLRVWASQTEFDGEPLTFCSIVNIAEEKRRLFLERSFLHDIINTASALREFYSLAESQPESPERTEYMETVGTLSDRLLQEIIGHQLLIAAESDQLKPNLKRLDARRLLTQLFAVYNRPDLLNGRFLVLSAECESAEFLSDEVLVSRVVGNMIKNALEAAPPQGTVTVGCRRDADNVAFWVHNSNHMPENVRLQVFYRNFSTKGAGRGLGTYSMKYFTEKYLRGSVTFTSTEEEGTTFIARYPLAQD